METLLSLTRGNLSSKPSRSNYCCDALNKGNGNGNGNGNGFGVPMRPRHRFSVSSKYSPYQDFQEYVKPKRLLPVRGLESVVGDDPPEKFISSIESDGSQSLYNILLRTSSMYGSGLSDLNAGVLICLIDDHGDSILERIPALLCQDHEQRSEESKFFDHAHFNRGSVDKFVFWGPKLGRIQAMWISVESGNWRLGGASLRTLSICEHHSEECSTNEDLLYKFDVEDVLLGEGSETPMAELRPCQVSDCCGDDPFEIPDTNVAIEERRRMTEESMREYSDLKFSQLLYDSMLIIAGTSISAMTIGQDSAVAFSMGGIGGFLYLVLLQRSVDKLPAPDSGVRVTSETTQTGGVQAPLLLLAFVFGVSLVTVKHGIPQVQLGFAPPNILLGMLGFLVSKLAVVLSAIKTLPMSKEDNK